METAAWVVGSWGFIVLVGLALRPAAARWPRVELWYYLAPGVWLSAWLGAAVGAVAACLVGG